MGVIEGTMLAASLRGRLPPSGVEFQSHPPSLSSTEGPS